MSEFPHEERRASPRTPPAVSPPPSEAIARQAAADYFAALRTRRRESRALVLVVLAVLALFGFSTYRTLRRNFPEDLLRRQAVVVASELAHEASPTLLSVLMDVAPVYRAEAERVFEETMPILAAHTERELDEAVDHLCARSREALRQALLAPLEGAVRDMAELSPNLLDPAFVEAAIEECESSVRSEMETLLADLDARYRPPAERLLAAVAALDEGGPLPDELQLKRRFLHLWLALIDSELMEGEPEASFSVERERRGKTPSQGG